MSWKTIAFSALLALGTLTPSFAAQQPANERPDVASPGSAMSTPEPLLFSEDFEAYGDSSRWQSDHPFPVQQDVVGTGAWSARLTSTGTTPAYGARRLAANHQRLFVRMSFNMIDMGPGPVTILRLRATDSTPVLTVQLTPAGRINYVTGPTGITSASQPVASLSQWHHLHIGIDTTASSGSIRIWIDQSELTTLNQDAWLGDANIRSIEIGDNTSGRWMDLAIDDVLVDDAFIPASRQADPVHGTLRVRTIPASPDVIFELDGETFVSDASGVARIQVRRWSTDLRNRITVHDLDLGTSSRLSFVGWREWMSPRTKDVYAAFSVWKPVAFSFVDTYGATVDPVDIDSITLKNSIGDIRTLRGADLDESILFVSGVITTPTGLNLKPVTWYVDEVIIDGSNVVNRSQQRTTLDSSSTWTIELLYFGVRFQSADAFFGTPLGTHIIIEAADGSRYRHALDENGYVAIPRIPRGEYLVSVDGGGYSPPRPIRVSRDQTVQLEVVSTLDLLLLVGTGGVVGVGLVVAGRPFIVTTPVRFAVALVTRRPYLRPDGGQA